MLKRTFDFVISLLSVFVFSGILFICFIVASIDTRSFGIFAQKRIGQGAKCFKIFKIKTLPQHSTVATRVGRFLRASKLDELPQLFNIIVGNMSFVGPRPDISGYADKLHGDNRIILSVKPGITGLASLKYINEEELLKNHKNSAKFNDEIIWPDKVRINKWYIENRSFMMDLQIIIYTVLPLRFDVEEFISNYQKIPY